MRRAVLAILLAVLPAAGATKVLVTVVQQKSGQPVTDLKAADFTLLDDRTPRRVEAAEFVSDPLDVMLLVDTSVVGEMVQPVAQNLIEQLQPKEQMAIVAVHSAADLIQEFTSSRQLLGQALARIKYGNTPRLLDGLYASIEDGFGGTAFRRVVILATAGMEGGGRVNERDVIRLARRNGVSIFPVYVTGYDRSMFENLARQTGGASFNLRDMKRASEEPPGPRILRVLRSHYTLTVTGNLGLGEKVKVEVKRPEKLFISALPLE
ncbi:MAG: VWA domain-containing protein [Bryobacterales bacterium]|nr:VWA domain-containing protein [Bryobacterales bacterium]